MDRPEGSFQVAVSWTDILASDYFEARCALNGNYEIKLINVDINSNDLQHSGSSEPHFALSVTSPFFGGGVSNVPTGWLLNLSVIMQRTNEHRLQLYSEVQGPSFITQLQGSLPLIFGSNINGAMSSSLPKYPVLGPTAAIQPYWTTAITGLLIFTFSYKQIK
jgi:hypothetical protein